MDACMTLLSITCLSCIVPVSFIGGETSNIRWEQHIFL